MLLSLTDPQARWAVAPGGPAFYAYSRNYLIDTEHGVIMDVAPTPAHRTAKVESTKTMIERVEAQFDFKPERLIGDTAHVTAPMLAWMVEEKGIEPHVPVWDKTERKNDSFSSNDFHWVARRMNSRWPQRCRTCDGRPNYHLKAPQSGDRCACTQQKTSN